MIVLSVRHILFRDGRRRDLEDELRGYIIKLNGLIKVQDFRELLHGAKSKKKNLDDTLG